MHEMINPNKLLVQNPDDKNKSENLESLEKLKTPDQLLDYMNSRITYGWIGKDNGKLYSPKYEGWGVGEQPNDYFLQTPEELLSSKHGLCWDQTELERLWFSKNNFEFKTFIAMFSERDISQKNPAHTFLTYKNKDKWYWFENAFGDYKGIHEFANLGDLEERIKNIICDSAKRNGATEEDLKKFKFCEYDKPTYGCNRNEFVEEIIKKHTL
jgi:hypothetical protein